MHVYNPQLDKAAFVPIASADIAASSTSARAALPSATGRQLRVHNQATVIARVKFGDVTVTAAAGDLSLPGPSTEVFTVPDGATYVAVILASGTGTVNVTSGNGW